MTTYTRLDLNDKRYAGGLGNNLFQIAAMIGEAKKNNCDWGVPDDWRYLKYFPNMKIWDTIKPITGFTLFNEKKEMLYEPFPKNEGVVDIRGYFQNAEYFKDAEDEVRHAFKIDTDIELVRGECTHNSVAIHLRFGDFEGKHGYHFMPQKDYYLNAINNLNAVRRSGNVLLLITNNPDKAIALLGKEFCEGNIKNHLYLGFYSDIEDLHLMTQCDYIITSASTFSYWGAWLSKSKNVVCPKVWYGGSAVNVLPDLQALTTVPKNWIRV